MLNNCNSTDTYVGDDLSAKKMNEETNLEGDGDAVDTWRGDWKQGCWQCSWR